MQPGYLVELNQEKSDNWISESEFCNHTKINTVAFIMRKMFLFLAFGSFPFRECVHVQDTVSDLKFSTRSVPVDIYN